MADKLSIASLGRAWQMLLKGIGEVEQAPDRGAAAEMVLIRLCYLADLPTPGDLVKRIVAEGPGSGGSIASSVPAMGGGGGVASSGGVGGSARAVTGGSAATAMAQLIPASPPQEAAAPRLGSFRDVVALVAGRREPMLHAHLLHSVHLVRFAPPVIELRPQAEAPRDLASRLAALLLEVTGTRWTIALSSAAGEPTLAEQGGAADTARREAAADHPLVKAILEAFPGARIEAVHDKGLDAYGLAAEPEAPPMLEFAPDDAEFVTEQPDADLADE